MGPLAKLWKIVEVIKQAEDQAVQISVNELLLYVEQIVLLLGQSSNAIRYHRRLNVLGGIINSQYQVKSMLKEKAALLQKHDSELFGIKFRNHIADTIKSKRETRKIFTDSKNPPSWSKWQKVTQNLKMVGLAKEIWEYIFKWVTTITTEYLPSKLNVAAEWESRNSLYSSEWMLSHQIFQKVCQIRGFPEIDLFASRLSHQIPTYVAWKPDPHSHATDAFQQNWSHKLLYAFPPFCMIPKVLNKTLKEQVPKLILITPAWTTQVWYPKILNMSIKSPILLP